MAINLKSLSTLRGPVANAQTGQRARPVDSSVAKQVKQQGLARAAELATGFYADWARGAVDIAEKNLSDYKARRRQELRTESAKLLAEHMGIKRLKREGSRWVPRLGTVVINWGCTKLPDRIDQGPNSIVNYPSSVKVAANKLSFFQLLSATELVPPHTTDRAVAEGWINDGKKVCVRETVTGREGQGLSIASTLAELKDAPLYTLYVPKKDEYRVHVMDGEVISVQRKARRLTCESPDWQIRNHPNGFVFARENCAPPL